MSSQFEVEKAHANVPMSAGERRRAALAEIDEASFSWFHAKACIVAGVGFFTDAYDIFSISIAATMIGYVYHNGGSNTSNQDLGIKVAHSIGTFFGQLLFGYLADRIGRKRMYGVELMIIIIGTLGQAVAGHAPGVNIYGVLIMWRFIMGIGIGGDYPVSSVITSEFAARKIRGRMMAAVFSAQGWGNFACAIVAVIVVAAYKNSIHSQPLDDLKSVDQAWRLIIGIGCVPAVIALYFRLTIPETPRYTMDVERNIKQASQDVDAYITTGQYIADPVQINDRAEVPKASWSDFIRHFGQWQNGKVLLGTAWSWFALDIAFYGLGLNSSTILSTIGFGSSTDLPTKQENIYQTLYNVAVGNIILAVGGLIPGYYFTMAFIDSWGRKPIQLMGFVLLTIIFVCMGFGYDKMLSTDSGKKAFVFLYCMANFFQNFGPNTTTFIVPGEVFPTRYRSTAHGISAASGKLGAIVAQVGFSRLINIGGKNMFLKHILEIFAFFMLTGVFSTLLLPETKNRSLEDLSQEDQENFVRNSGMTTAVPMVQKTGTSSDDEKIPAE
ncbi:phosphate:H+ symporter [Cryptococcus neoformans C23]|uniref:Phosphate:H symporter n=2 Tax=Cryptococcus neoformans TaxID=5207 RepID=J9VMW8_CRYN9|nr:phosphate:H symporter [Cryptococcus neoformans var. grubii H99]XP_012048125.1 phosphate:H symporter, variant [Cryptococcus neoformans var. grubii H99]AUB23505.1 phosphate:H symporter [Cryptococcus neoformans var. grubii]OWZ34489.1 phosphate:H+ symporter [Cryptococcus neoformans var. grubii AD2-60a]OWZ46573.1 phosphate:H+ symporter [Cryptococcus neoformans var. grubii C23]OWZ49306.1 phosphate:H+ symporter [Cryptococcus neoformans var. grubii AD1-83a]OWZ55695.1 phosphate:H+ symporter [Crypto|eukprot:XP_012048124.1 phosphate:H symporter [Cryptococcus neoformans var. grubii H99]